VSKKVGIKKKGSCAACRTKNESHKETKITGDTVHGIDMGKLIKKKGVKRNVL
jgi:hypothetical protein